MIKKMILLSISSIILSESMIELSSTEVNSQRFVIEERQQKNDIGLKKMLEEMKV